MTWPFPIDVTAADMRAILQNVAASVLLIFAGDVLVRGLLSIVLGARPRLRIQPGAPKAMRDLDWPHLVVRNVGLLLSPRTRAAEGVIAFGKLDGVDVRFQWSTSDTRPPSQIDIYGDREAEIPLIVRARAGAPARLYGNVMPAQTAHLTEVEFLTQGFPGKAAPWPLEVGTHELEFHVQALDGTRTAAKLFLDVPPWPRPLRIRRESDAGDRARTRDEQIGERGRALVALVERELPKDFDVAQRWPAIGVALLSRMTTTLSSVLDMHDSRRLEADAAILVRSLYEHAVHFAWLAADPSRERLDHWRKHDLLARLKADEDARAHGFEEMLRPERRAEFETQLAAIAGAVPLNLADLAIAADNHWGGRIHGMGKHDEPLSFRGWYAFLYRSVSPMAHPSEIGLHRVTDELAPGRLRIDIERPSSTRTGPYGMATFVFGVALYIAAEILGWPDAETVSEIFDRTT